MSKRKASRSDTRRNEPNGAKRAVSQRRPEGRLADLARALRLLLRSPLIMAGVMIVLALLLASIFAPWIATHEPDARDWRNQLSAPSAAHFFGTDANGADVFSKVIFGARTTVQLGIVIVALAGILGVSLGVTASYYGKLADVLIMRAADVFLSIPGLVLAMAVIVLLGSGLQNVMLAIVLVRWPAYARLARAQALSIQEEQFVEAVRSLGGNGFRIIRKHILPNAIAPLIVYATLDMGTIILLAAGLSFIGLGAGPGAAEWGRMVAEGRAYFFQQPWLVTFPGLAIFVSVLGFNLLGDGIRDALDPKLRRSIQ